MINELQVIFEPSGQRVYVLPGTPLLEAAIRAGLIVDTPCGGAGTCGKCRVKIVSGTAASTEAELKTLSSVEAEQGWRLACQCRVHTDLTVEVPESSLVQACRQILLDDIGTGLESGVEPGSRTGFGVAFDIGTTTLVGTLVDLGTGAILAVHGEMNPQTSYGDDVISRIKRCIDHEKGLEVLNHKIIGAVNDICAKLCAAAGISPDSVIRVVFAGNTAMQEIVCNINPRQLGEIPFTPAFTTAQIRKATELGINISEKAEVFVFPQIGGFVGGDTVAGLVATRLDRIPGPALFIDVGTNGELVLAHEGNLYAASVAAGPAFEGARIQNGMRAAQGAVEKVVIGDDVIINVIGNEKAAGICGSALIDAAAGLLNVGIIDSMGRVLDPSELSDDLSPALAERVIRSDGHSDFMLVRGEDTVSGQPIHIFQRDIRELQLANGAIRAGIRILLKKCGLTASRLETVLVAGAFGNFIRRGNARRIGMLPDIPSEKIRFVGNTASFGARKVLVSAEEQEYASDLQRRIVHVDLSADTEFHSEFGAGMIFP